MELPNFVNSSADSLSKNRHDFSNKLVQKVELSTNYFYKKYAPKQVFFNEKKITLKVRFRPFLMTSQWMDSQNKVVSFEYS